VAKNFKLIKDPSRKDFYHLLLEDSDSFGLKTTITYFEVDMASFAPVCLKAKHEINIDVLTKIGDSILDKSTLTFKDTNESLLIIFFNSVLIFFDMDTGKLITKKDLSQHDLNNKEYFLSPTNLITSKLDSIESIFNTHNFIALNNLKNLILVRFYSRTSLKTFQSSSNIKFETFKLNQNYLVAYNLNESKLFVYSIKKLLETNSFDKFEFELELRNHSLFQFGSNDQLFVIESKKILKLYDLSKNKLLGEMPLYSESNLIACSDDFAMLAMKDKRLISYLICDLNLEESNRKIDNLTSRFGYFHIFHFDFIYFFSFCFK
jgi:hypothetical protein